MDTEIQSLVQTWSVGAGMEAVYQCRGCAQIWNVQTEMKRVYRDVACVQSWSVWREPVEDG